MGIPSSLPLWTNEVEALNDNALPYNFGASTCLGMTRKAVAVSGACACDFNDQLVYSKPAFINATDGTAVPCGVGALRLGVRPIACNTWLCGCAAEDRFTGVAGSVVSQVYCS
jgi:hypothetical protein